MAFKNLLLGLGLFLASANALAEEARIINVVGRVTIDGKPAKVGDPVPVGAKVETGAGGSATIAAGEENVMKISSESILQLELASEGGKQLNVILEQGRVEGVRRVDEAGASGATKVATGSGTMEISGGRYLIEKPAQEGKETVFLAVDGGAKLVSNSKAVLGGSEGAGLSMNKGEMVTLQSVSTASDNRQVVAIGDRMPLTPEQAAQARVPVPEIPQRQLASAPTPPAEPPTFRNTLPSGPSPINQDPTQPIVPRDPRVKVIFKY